ncbi:TPA: hypothetical protein ACP4ZK_005088, partial [Escherichia coli]
MKYLAVLLAILSAASAWGADLIDYVPSSVTVTATYKLDVDDRKASYYKHYATGDSVEASVPFSDRERERLQMTVYNAVNDIRTDLRDGTFALSGPNGITVFLNDVFSLTARYMPWYSDGQSIPYDHDAMSNAYIPAHDDSDQQRLRIRCGAPSHITGQPGATYLYLGAILYLQPPGDPSISNMRTIDVLCKWHLRANYRLSLTLEKTVMQIVGTAGSTAVHNNKLLVTGNGGPVQITIDNPSQEDLSTSFSGVKPHVLTTTTTPTLAGTTLPLYVAVLNTR